MKVSIIVRAKNEIHAVEDAITMINNQTYTDYEIVVVDSGSTDGTYEVLENCKPNVIYQIDPATYIPGKVLNEAIKRCSGEIIVFNNADCVPENEFWLEKLIAPLNDETIAATFSRQIAKDSVNRLVQKDCERSFGDGEEHKKWKHFFSLASSAVRRDLITEFPFDATITYSEDIDWSYKMKKRGKKVYYVKESIVEHRHDYTIKSVYKRAFGEGLAESKIYGVSKKESSLLFGFCKPYVAEVLRDTIYFFKERDIKSILYSYIFRFSQKYGMYKGRKV